MVAPLDSCDMSEGVFEIAPGASDIDSNAAGTAVAVTEVDNDVVEEADDGGAIADSDVGGG